MTALSAAYVAGLMDGEGCIYINLTKKGYMSTAVTVGMTTRALPILEALKKQYGGSVHRHGRPTEKWDTSYAWRVSGDLAVKVLREIEPLLKLKAEQARLGMKLEEIKAEHRKRLGRTGSWTACAQERCQAIRRRMFELNATGPRKPEPVTPAGYRRVARLVAGQWMTDQADMFSDLGWEPFKGTWPTSGLMLDGVLFEPVTPEPPISVIASSLPPGQRLLPTPGAADWKGSGQTQGRTRSNGRPRTWADMDLPEAIALLPTPQSRDWKGPPGKGSQASGGHQSSLPAAIAVLTGDRTPPQSRGGKRSRHAQHPGQLSLDLTETSG